MADNSWPSMSPVSRPSTVRSTSPLLSKLAQNRWSASVEQGHADPLRFAHAHVSFALAQSVMFDPLSCILMIAPLFECPSRLSTPVLATISRHYGCGPLALPTINAVF